MINKVSTKFIKPCAWRKIQAILNKPPCFKLYLAFFGQQTFFPFNLNIKSSVVVCFRVKELGRFWWQLGLVLNVVLSDQSNAFILPKFCIFVNQFCYFPIKSPVVLQNFRSHCVWVSILPISTMPRLQRSCRTAFLASFVKKSATWSSSCSSCIYSVTFFMNKTVINSSVFCLFMIHHISFNRRTIAWSRPPIISRTYSISIWIPYKIQMTMTATKNNLARRTLNIVQESSYGELGAPVDLLHSAEVFQVNRPLRVWLRPTGSLTDLLWL